MSRRRPYLDLKASILELFRTTARWLHDTVKVESLFEKPYLDQDYRQMHLNMPDPDWPSTPEGDGFFPDESGFWTFKFDPGICTLGVLSLGCGEDGWLGVSIGLLPPGSADKSIAWSAESSDPNLVEIIGIENGISGKIHLKASEEDSGTATICVRGTLEGEAIKELVVPFSGGGVLDYRVAASIPAFSREYYDGHLYTCGCIDLEIECEECDDDTQIAYDDVSSPDTINAGTAPGCTTPSSAMVYITDGADGSPYTWSITGTGFWLNSGCTITSLKTDSLNINVYTDADACGPGVITITGCNGSTTTGYIRCTTGVWNTIATYVGIPTGYSGNCLLTCCDGSGLFGGFGAMGSPAYIYHNLIERMKMFGGTCDVYYAGSGGSFCGSLTSVSATFTNSGDLVDWREFVLGRYGGSASFACSGRTNYFQEWRCS